MKTVEFRQPDMSPEDPQSPDFRKDWWCVDHNKEWATVRDEDAGPWIPAKQLNNRKAVKYPTEPESTVPR